MNEFIEMFLQKKNATNDQTKWFFKNFKFDEELNQEIQSVVVNMKYSEFLKTTYWQTIAAIVKDNSDNKCQICGSNQNLEVHHKVYNNHGFEHLEAIRNDDLICLCDKCHKKEHDIKNTETFIFYESWLSFIEFIEKAKGREYANEFCRQICEFGIKGTNNSDDTILKGFISGCIEPLISACKRNYKKSKYKKIIESEDDEI